MLRVFYIGSFLINFPLPPYIVKTCILQIVMENCLNLLQGRLRQTYVVKTGSDSFSANVRQQVTDHRRQPYKAMFRGTLKKPRSLLKGHKCIV